MVTNRCCPRRDIEWAFDDGTLYLLQCRAVTTGKGRSAVPPPGPPARDPVAALQRVQLFADMTRRQVEQLARLLKERRFAQGETVILEGSGAAAFFLIHSGEATVTAATDLVCYGLTFWEFRPLVESNGTLAWKLLQALARRVRAAEERGAASFPLEYGLEHEHSAAWTDWQKTCQSSA